MPLIALDHVPVSETRPLDRCDRAVTDHHSRTPLQFDAFFGFFLSYPSARAAVSGL